ncbi:hypothetical protein HFN89_05410 [Rhizobium laguerreae]|nr:hypothetical protein [Rhizobium laguerreae]
MSDIAKSMAERIRNWSRVENGQETRSSRSEPYSGNPRRFHSFLRYEGDLERYMVDLDHGIRWRCSVGEQLKYPYVSSGGFRITTNPAWSWGLKEVEPTEAREIINGTGEDFSPPTYGISPPTSGMKR